MRVVLELVEAKVEEGLGLRVRGTADEELEVLVDQTAVNMMSLVKVRRMVVLVGSEVADLAQHRKEGLKEQPRLGGDQGPKELGETRLVLRLGGRVLR